GPVGAPAPHSSAALTPVGPVTQPSGSSFYVPLQLTGSPFSVPPPAEFQAPSFSPGTPSLRPSAPSSSLSGAYSSRDVSPAFLWCHQPSLSSLSEWTHDGSTGTLWAHKYIPLRIGKEVYGEKICTISLFCTSNGGRRSKRLFVLPCSSELRSSHILKSRVAKIRLQHCYTFPDCLLPREVPLF
ncbi:unnamed protein product, partial [Heterosigma akashiwo]